MVEALNPFHKLAYFNRGLKMKFSNILHSDLLFLESVIDIYSDNKTKIIAIWQNEEFVHEQEICEYYYCHGDIIYKVDNIVYYNEIDVDFVKEYKDYRFEELYSINTEHYKFKQKNIQIPSNIIHKNNISPESLALLQDFIKTSLYPYRRYNITDYYLELARISQKLGFDNYFNYFLDFIEINLEFNKAYLRERYVSFIKCENFEKAFIYLQKIFDKNLQDNFDYMNMGYILKMKGEYLKALDYYLKFTPENTEHSFVKNDMIFCAENIENNKKIMELIKEKWKF
ncbi:MAG: hypothetical protein M0R46_15955 [Candidatus Muirbacterium halophilum]|nr:hypothetical protein [Candidatus Muirbacterium halophilum]MCK9477410.1 hypothetical protein [Candidatus Muirbacterium halophilum]